MAAWIRKAGTREGDELGFRITMAAWIRKAGTREGDELFTLSLCLLIYSEKITVRELIKEEDCVCPKILNFF